ncbi:MAG TPA: hypothetical protein VMF11_03080 [Candidatus Baltobacteraceae bacterium]|nr:hypothetical protein [Candidatus Baltobacteraceae bacterium]
MAVESPPPANGLKTAWDTVVAPKAAFESIRIAPTWGWALLIALVLFGIGYYLMVPANQHALATDWPNMVAQNPIIAGLSSAEQQERLQTVLAISAYGWIFAIIFVPIGILISAVVYLIFDRIGHGEGSFGKYWAAACNIAVIPGLGIVVNALIVLIRGADSFAKPIDVPAAMPSLIMLAPQAGPKLAVILASISPFSLWATGLGIAAISFVGRVPRVPAWLGGIAAFLVPVLIGAAFAR